MNVYLASVFADKDRVKARCEELNALGIKTTSRWASENAPHNCKTTDKPAQYRTETAVFDVEDIVKADKVVLTVPTPQEAMNLTPHQMIRGGRHFESGMMYGMILAKWLDYGKARWESDPPEYRRELILMGERENVFHFLNGEGVAVKYPAIVVKPTWEEVKSYLQSQV